MQQSSTHPTGLTLSRHVTFSSSAREKFPVAFAQGLRDCKMEIVTENAMCNQSSNVPRGKQPCRVIFC